MSSAPDNAVPALADEVPTAAPTAAPLAGPVDRASLGTDIALVASFAAFIAVCSLVPGIPVGDLGVPITLQTFAVVLAGLVLGWRRGGLAALLYVVVGLAGVPIFAEGVGGVSVLAGGSAGYLLAFPFGAAAAGALGSLAIRWSAPGTTAGPRWRFPFLSLAAIAASLLVIHVAGIAVLMARFDMSLHAALVTDAAYIPGDVIKSVLAAAVTVGIFQAFPDMLRSRR